MTGCEPSGGALPRPRRQIPFVQQMEAADCAAACLAMVLAYWRCEVAQETLRNEMGIGGDGASASRILELAGRYGLAARGLRVEVEDLRTLPRGTVLHWEFRHFVVLDRVTRNGVVVVDPAGGRRVATFDEVDRAFTGVALAFEPTRALLRRTRPKQVVWPYIRRLFGDRAIVGRLVAMSLVLQTLTAILPVVIGVVVDDVIPRRDMDLMQTLVVLAVSAALMGATATLVRSHLLVTLRTRLDHRMTLDFMSHLVSLPFGYFQRRSTGDLMLRVSSNATVREFLTSNALSSLLDVSFVGLYIVLIAAIAPSMALVVLGLGAVRVLTLISVYNANAELMATELEARAQAHGQLAQLVAGIETLKFAGAEQRAVGQWMGHYTAELNAGVRKGRLAAWVEAALHGLGAVSPLLVLGWGAYLVVQGGMSLGTVIAVGALAGEFFRPLAALVASGLKLSELRSYLERMEDVLTAKPEQEHRQTRPAPRIAGHISLRGVTHRYRPDGPCAIANVDLDIAPGQTVAIVGPSGSGKTTLARVMLGFCRASEGDVRIDGHSVAELCTASLRAQVGVVPQQPYFFGTSIRDNIALSAPGAGLSDVAAAARIACIDQDITSTPMQYDTVLADRGESLSGGQRQRLAIARAVVHRPSILLLDEATSALDTETEARVTQNLDRLRCTRIVVAHRLSTIVHADVIVVMDGGRIVDAGRHQELLGRGSVYRRLVGHQVEVTGPRGGA